MKRREAKGPVLSFFLSSLPLVFSFPFDVGRQLVPCVRKKELNLPGMSRVLDLTLLAEMLVFVLCFVERLRYVLAVFFPLLFSFFSNDFLRQNLSANVLDI